MPEDSCQDIDWSQWPPPNPAHGDGSAFAETTTNDGTPGAVGS